MGSDVYHATDRRPIAARQWAVMNRLAAALARAGVSANAISLSGMICAILGGVCLWQTATADVIPLRITWLAAAALIQLRLLANLLDGMVAISTGKASPLGELFNDAPDRISDVAILIGMGYALGGHPILGWVAALLALLTAYVRVLGKSLGVPSDFRGPMAKPHRMFFVTVVALLNAAAPSGLQQLSPVLWCLAVICVGCLITIGRRMLNIASALRSRPR
ncbi:MAG TPA: CDP-alcohol phosphatidyltransferase family protein [Phycisphaerae bacterium]|nr:CDP-alcohol phosphatidyltransferase family protein [Phycisphaerae bacterium]